jgi:hypothetical protein
MNTELNKYLTSESISKKVVATLTYQARIAIDLSDYLTQEEIGLVTKVEVEYANLRVHFSHYYRDFYLNEEHQVGYEDIDYSYPNVDLFNAFELDVVSLLNDHFPNAQFNNLKDAQTVAYKLAEIGLEKLYPEVEHKAWVDVVHLYTTESKEKLDALYSKFLVDLIKKFL